MSVRVNLLPREFEERSRQRRLAGLGVLVVLAWVGLLAFLLLGKLGAVDDARATRDAAQAQVNQLQAEVNALAQFQQLATNLSAGNDVLATAMANEVSWAQLLNDVALTIPSTTSLTDMTASILDLPPGGIGGDVFVENEVSDIGVMNLDGYTVDRLAPGVEAVLLRFGEVENFFQQYLSTAQQASILDVEVTDFTADVLLSEDLRTQRYADGLPEVGQ